MPKKKKDEPEYTRANKDLTEEEWGEVKAQALKSFTENLDTRIKKIQAREEETTMYMDLFTRVNVHDLYRNK